MVRILTAVVLIALLAASLALAPPFYAAMLVVFVALAWQEFASLAAEAGATPLRGLGMLLALGCALSFAAPEPLTPVVAMGGAMILGTVASLAAGKRHPVLAVRRAVATLGGCLWLGVLPGFHLALRYRDDGVIWLVFLYVSVAAGDIAALYGGRLFGRRPLAPSLSPKKTLEGGAFGLVASMVGAGMVANYWMPGLEAPRAILIGLLLGAIGQAGDLFESALKRAAKTKDSSEILPGHGGILDRIDSLLFAGAALFAILFLDLA